MKLVVNKDRTVYSAGTWGTVNENDYEILEFEFPEELDNYNKRIVYYLDNERVWDAIVDNKAYITNAITKYERVKAYIWLTKENTEREADTDFRTKLFEMQFFENENADGIVPTEQQVDGFNTMLTAMNRKIDEVNALETVIEQEEADRQEAEISREERTNQAIENIIDMTAAYNANAVEKTNQFDSHVTSKTEDFDSHVSDKTDEFDEHADDRKEELDDIAEAIEDMTTAIQFATFEVDDTMHLNIIQAEKLKNTNFIFNPDTGRLGVSIYNG